jgi:DNA mismatch repair ATPase MutS
MQDPLEFYQTEKQLFEHEYTSIKKKLARSSIFRLLVFTGTVLGIYSFFGQFEIIIPIALSGIVLFLFLLIKHNNLQQLKDLKKALISINQREIDVLNGDYFSLEEGNEYVDQNHYYSFDIDLFGRGSFFQYSNRTATKEGEKKLAAFLSHNDISNIQQKQEVIVELSKKPKWRQYFTAIANLVKTTYPEKEILQWICNYTSVFPKFLSFVPVIFSIISLVLITLFGFQIISSQILLFWFFIGLGFSGFYLKKVNTLYDNASKAKDTFKQYHQLLDEIERIELDSPLLKEKQNDIQTHSLKASLILNQFSKIINALDQRNNDLMAIILNGFFLWDLRQVYKIEKWIKSYHDKVEKWFEVIAFFDAQNSLANFVFNHPKYAFPKIIENKKTIVATNLGHPLLHVSKRIDNDFYIDDQHFYIITGANMAGKSTFLRTVSLSIIMANAGLPVCAQKFDYSPIKLITSMRTSDSLTDDESYFFSELKRLKFIVDKIKQDKYYVVLDEILKGTNSKDKALGSKKFIEKLVDSGSTGMVATHDLSLCEIEKDHQQIDNYFFDAQIINNELYFDFKLKTGICKNMNASFLLKKMEII